MSLAAVDPLASGNVLLLIGEPQVGKHYLVKHMQTDTPTAPAPAAVVKDAETRIERHALTLDTKYYSADLTIHLLPSDTHAAFADGTDTLLTPGARAAFQSLDAQAVLLVFSLARSATFHALVNAWQTFLADRQPEVVMLVGNYHGLTNEPGQATEAEELEQLAKDWALDHQIEYVRLPRGDQLRSGQTRLAAPAAAAPASSSSARPAHSHSDDDDDLEAANEPVGLARIRESLECNQWPDLVMKDRKQMKFMQHQATAATAQSHLTDDSADQDDHDRREASAFASMQGEEEETKEADGKFEGFVGATAAAAPGASSASHTTTAAAATSAAASAARSASSSAFANAFASAIRTDEDKSKASSSKAESTTAAATTSSSIDDPLSIDDVDRLAAHLARISAAGEPAAATAPSSTAAGVAPTDVHEQPADAESERDGATFDALFDRITTMKSQLKQPKPDGSQWTDQERRAKAEQNVRALLASMGMEDELDGVSDDDDM